MRGNAAHGISFYFALLAVLWFAPLGRGSLLETNLPSKFFGWNRGIHLYLPPSYGSEPQRRYPVLHLHDGQNVFSSAGTNCAFGWGSWELDKTADALSRAGKMREIIMVAVDNSFTRYEEYCGRHHAADATTNTAFENYTAMASLGCPSAACAAVSSMEGAGRDISPSITPIPFMSRF